MSVQAITWAIEQNIPVAGQKLVLIALSNYATKAGVCFPGQEVLAKDTSQGTRTVRRHLTALEKTGFLQRTRRTREDGSRTSDEYQLNMLPANLAGREDSQPAKTCRSTGQIGRAILEPSVNQEDSTPSMVPPVVKIGNSHGTRLNPNWNTTARHFVLGNELGFDESWVRAESEKFRDYWTAESGQRARKRDWNAAFRVWLRKAAEYVGRSPRPPGQRQAGTGGCSDTGVVAALRKLQGQS